MLTQFYQAIFHIVYAIKTVDGKYQNQKTYVVAMRAKVLKLQLSKAQFSEKNFEISNSQTVFLIGQLHSAHSLMCKWPQN